MVGVFLSFRFCGCPIVAVAAKPGGPEAPESENPLGVSELIEVPAEEYNNKMCLNFALSLLDYIVLVCRAEEFPAFNVSFKEPDSLGIPSSEWRR